MRTERRRVTSLPFRLSAILPETAKAAVLINLGQLLDDAYYQSNRGADGFRHTCGTADRLNGADNVTIDGLNAAGNSLTLDNTSTTATASTVHFIADAIE